MRRPAATTPKRSMPMLAIFRESDCAPAAATWASPPTPPSKRPSSDRWPGQAGSSKRDVLPQSFLARVPRHPGIALGRRRGALSAGPVAQAPHGPHTALLCRYRKAARIETPPQAATTLVAAVAVDQSAAAVAGYRATPPWFASPIF